MSGKISPGRHCHSTLSSAVVGCHSLGIYIVVLLPLLSLSVKMTASPRANGAGQPEQRDAALQYDHPDHPPAHRLAGGALRGPGDRPGHQLEAGPQELAREIQV